VPTGEASPGERLLVLLFAPLYVVILAPLVCVTVSGNW
jgi:hypothetical protein